MPHRIKLWGIKGSCPGAAQHAAEHGSNTSCIEISCPDELLILDAGSGLIHMGQTQQNFSDYKRISLFITHYHYDHIIGLPFFRQAYNPHLTFHVYGPKWSGGGPAEALKGLFVQPYLPMGFEALNAQFVFHALESGAEVTTPNYTVSAFATDHPGGNLAYRVDSHGKRFSYLTDLGHIPEIHDALCHFVHKSDWIYYDANFTASEYAHSRYEGWGHSTPDKGFQLLKDSKSKKLLVGHHALHRTDEELEQLQKQHDSKEVIVTRDFMVLRWGGSRHDG